MFDSLGGDAGPDWRAPSAIAERKAVFRPRFVAPESVWGSRTGRWSAWQSLPS